MHRFRVETELPQLLEVGGSPVTALRALEAPEHLGSGQSSQRAWEAAGKGAWCSEQADSWLSVRGRQGALSGGGAEESSDSSLSHPGGPF